MRSISDSQSIFSSIDYPRRNTVYSIHGRFQSSPPGSTYNSHRNYSGTSLKGAFKSYNLRAISPSTKREPENILNFLPGIQDYKNSQCFFFYRQKFNYLSDRRLSELNTQTANNFFKIASAYREGKKPLRRGYIKKKTMSDLANRSKLSRPDNSKNSSQVEEDSKKMEVTNEAKKSRHIKTMVNFYKRKDSNYFSATQTIFSIPKRQILSPKARKANSKNHNIREIQNCQEEKSQNKNNNNTLNILTRKSVKFDLNTFKKTHNLRKIISKVIENNKKAEQIKNSNYFDNLGKDYLRKYMSKSNNINKRKSKLSYSQEAKRDKSPKTSQNFLNSIILELPNAEAWKKHELAWLKITKAKAIDRASQKDIMPPNYRDVLISSFCMLHSKIATENSPNTFHYEINDSIENPKKEMKKWKNAYKNVILRWHPDKIFSFLAEKRSSDENIIKKIKSVSNIIVNNTNELYKSILEILNKIHRKKKI